MPSLHLRLPWRATDPSHVLVHAKWRELQGTFQRSIREAAPHVELYERAKHRFDMPAAVELVEKHVKNQSVDDLVDNLILTGKPARIVYPNPEFDAGSEVNVNDSPTNAIPAAFAAYLAVQLGCDVDDKICQISRPGRTKLSIVQRFVWQPAFDGDVSPDVAYILADDVCSKGGTLAALRNHIVGKGGTVIAVTSLASRDGCHVPFPIASTTEAVLKQSYGSDLDDLFMKEVGHATKCLTELEGQGLAEWYRQNCLGARISPIQRLRDRFAKVKEKGL